MKILVVEDEPQLRSSIKESLLKESYLVEEAADFVEASEKIWSFEYDCVLLDVMLPGGSGLKVLYELKQMGKQASVIIISAKDSLDDKLAGLDLGADDYLVKPFYLAELNARVKSVLRRTSFGGNEILTFGNVNLDVVERAVTVKGEALQLNRKEFDSLSYFFLNKERLVSKTSLAEHVWGDYVDQANDFEFVYSQIKNLRKKLKDTGASIEIQSVYGMGYRLMTK